MSAAAGVAARPGPLVVENITRRFNATAGVTDVTFTVAPGELLALVGASGSGKTTTLRIVAGYETPERGRVLIGGADITRLPPERRGFGMVFQHYALFPHMSVEENVAFGLEARGVNRVDRLTRAQSALASVGLEGAGPRPVQSLSGGEQQRVALARAVVIEPRALLLDEPLSNLDPALRRTMRAELSAMLRRVNVAALFVTHDQDDAFAIADRVALLRAGKILQVGAPEELYRAPASVEVARFIGRGTVVPAQLDGGAAIVRIGGVERRLPVAAAARPGSGSGYHVLLRPEALRLTAPDDAGAWPGEVLARRFAGATTVVSVELSDGTILEVESSRDAPAPGERVGVIPGGEPVSVFSA